MRSWRNGICGWNLSAFYFCVCRKMSPKTWHLETWYLEPGSWHLDPDTWYLESGTWHLAPAFGTCPFNSYNKAQFQNSGNQNSNLLQRNSTTNTTRWVVISTSVGKKIVLQLKIPTVPLAGRLMHLLSSWEKLTKDQNIFQIVKGYRIPFFCRPKQKGNQSK